MKFLNILTILFICSFSLSQCQLKNLYDPLVASEYSLTNVRSGDNQTYPFEGDFVIK